MRTTLRALCLALLLSGCTGTDVRTADSLLPPAALPTAVPSPTLLAVLPTLPSLSPPTAASSPPALPPPAGPRPERGRARGVVTDASNRVLAGVQVWRGDLSARLDVTDRQGHYDVPCGTPLLLSARDVRRLADVQDLRDSTTGNHAWRRVQPVCGTVTRTRLPAGGVVEGVAFVDSDRSGGCCTQVTFVRIQAERDGYPNDYASEGDPVFRADVAPDGSYRLDGLDTGRYWIEESVFGFADEGTYVGVREGTVADGTFAHYSHPDHCEHDGSCEEG